VHAQSISNVRIAGTVCQVTTATPPNSRLLCGTGGSDHGMRVTGQQMLPNGAHPPPKSEGDAASLLDSPREPARYGKKEHDPACEDENERFTVKMDMLGPQVAGRLPIGPEWSRFSGSTTR